MSYIDSTSGADITRSGVVAVSLEARKLRLQPPVMTRAAREEETVY